ncbi:methyl-accepting chemotaxis protein [Bacillus sp. RD4P76]|uniref:Methyl-accepting chemotaxis protein n=2 Tax=Bacillus suaedaesalsae TaxID=2810349 RepID=A0ABS2DN77_9BACI|nr:methyl-accepting chemotaxis protein [Bacillus suaedaesalsae]MBM6619485.1 methyl-accepting chemotaxis protein [Bacillus suaedaesalsae]
MKSLKVKLLLSFSVVLAIFALVTVATAIFVNQYNQNVEELVEKDVEILIADEILAANIQERIALVRGYVLFGDDSYVERFNEVTKESHDYEKKLLTLSTSSEAKRLIEESKQWETYIEDYLFPIVNTGDRALSEGILKDKVTPMGRNIDEGFKELALKRESDIKDKGKQLLSEGSNLILINIIIALIGIVVGIFVAMMMAIRITKPINMVSDRMALLAEGDLSQEELKTKSKDEIGKLVANVNKLVRNLRVLIGEVSDSTMQVTASSEELTASAEQSTEAAEQISSLAQTAAAGSEKQQISTEEVLAAMQQLSAGLEQVAKNGHDMNLLTEDANNVSATGASAVKQVVQQMNNIQTSVKETSDIITNLGDLSTEISNILSLITSIAEQTNLLALNAAIEAARAGEQGKGFAVVADEVRKLAEESRSSADQIASMISEIQSETKKAIKSMQSGQEKVSEGIGYTNSVTEAFTDIQSTNEQVNSKVTDVASAIQEMTSVSSNVLTAITEVSELAKEGATFSQSSSAANQEQLATMEEIAASAQSLSKLAEDLQIQINKFKL